MMQLKELEEGNIKGAKIGQLHPNDVIQRVEGEQHYGEGGGAMRDYCMQRVSTQRVGGGQT